MNFKIEQKEQYLLIRFSVEDEPAQPLSIALTPFLNKANLFTAFDFSTVRKLDLKSLSLLEPALQAVWKTGRKAALCGADPSMLKVLDAAGLLLNTVTFPDIASLEKSLADFLKKSQPTQKEKPSPYDERLQTKPHDWKNNLSLAPHIQTLALCLLLVLLIGGFLKTRSLQHQLDTVTIALSHVRTVSDSLRLKEQNQSAEEAILRELELATASSSSAESTPSTVGMETAEYDAASRAVRYAGKDFLQAQEQYRATHGNYAADAKALSFQPSDPNIRLESVSLSADKETASIILSTRTPHGRLLKWNIDTHHRWKAIP
ncbi:MAG: hypothetical protein A2293_05910 [Elusimicrobia bacterium RIFOXYB2_FULL_49_7]|nr:MAG: hypothetical protein A2293_05910 [Elusimicrobia bacterium RIFOXYB2_FULL_49_7]